MLGYKSTQPETWSLFLFCLWPSEELQQTMELSVQKSENNKFLGQSVQQIRDCALQTVSNWNPFANARLPAVVPCGLASAAYTLTHTTVELPCGAAHRIGKKSAYWPAAVRLATGLHGSEGSTDSCFIYLHNCFCRYIYLLCNFFFLQKRKMNPKRSSVSIFYFRN